MSHDKKDSVRNKNVAFSPKTYIVCYVETLYEMRNIF